MRLLSECDRKIARARRRLAAIPAERDAANAEIESSRQAFEEETRHLRGLELAQKEAELEIESREAETRKKQGRLLEVKTNRDYTALNTEIARLREEISALEEKALSLLDEIAAEKEAVGRRREELAGREKAWREKTAILDDEEKTTAAELARLEAARPALAGAINPETRKAYERILASRTDGLAMVALEGDACGGCLTRVATSARQQARRRDRLVYCEQCNRIIFHDAGRDGPGETG